MDIIRTTFKLFSVQIIITFLASFAIFIFARLLTPAQLGVFFLFQALSSILVSVASGGIETAAEKRISEGKPPHDILATAITLQAALLILIIGGIFFFYDTINAFIGGSFTLYLAAVIIVATFSNLAFGILRGELRVEATATLPLLNHVSWIGVGSILLLIGFGSEALIYAFLIGHIATFLGVSYRVSTSIGSPTREYAYSLLSYAKYSFIGVMSWQAYNWMDVLIIGWFLSQAAVGAYEIAWRVAAIVTILSSAIAANILPQVSAWNAKAETDRIEQLLYKTFTPSLLLIIPAIFGVAVLSREILGIVFGPEYTVAWLVLIILTAGKIPEGFQRVTSKCLEGLNRPDLMARATIIGAVLNIILNILFIQWFGIVGAAVATILAYTVGALLRFKYLSTIISVRIPYRELVWCAFSAAIMGGAVIQVRTILDIQTFTELIITVIIGVGVYTGVVLLSKTLRKQAIQTIRELLT